MGLLKKKSNQSDKTDVAQSTHPAKKKKNELFRVFDESVWESAHEDFKANKQFIIKDDVNGTQYVAILFDTTKIGGLVGKNAKKDEAKGSIIEAIRTGRIKAYIRNEMLADDTFVLIPDAETIDNMDEFNLLVNIDYVVCKVSPDGVVSTETVNGTNAEDDPELTVSFSTLQELITSNGDVMTLFDTNATGFMDASDPEAVDISDEPEDTIDEMYGEPDEDDDHIDDLDDDFSDIEQVSSSDISESDADSFDDDMADSKTDDVDSSYDNYSENYDDVQEQDDDGGYYEYEEINEEMVQDFVIRKFYSDDLGLEVSTQPFDAQFLHGNAYLPFNENRGAGWLNEYLSNFAKDANTRMDRLHNDNLFRMRERYMRLVQTHCENIAKSLDTFDDTTQYGLMRYGIEQHRQANLDTLEQSISAKKQQLEDLWNQKLEQVGEKAAHDAKQEYIDRYAHTHESDLINLEIREKDEIERDYNNAMKRMNDDRRAEASKLLDLAINETLKEMSALYLEVLQDEKKEYARLQNEMTRFIDANRKDEKARIDALAENNRQTQKAEEVRREYTAKIKALSAEFDTKKIMLQADIDRMQREHDAEIKNHNSAFDEKLNEERQKSAQLQSQIDELLKKYSDLDSEKRREYEDRMNEYENRIRAFEGERQDSVSREAHIIESHKRANLASVFLVIAILIAALGIGFMAGSIINVRRTSAIEQQSVYQLPQTTTSAKKSDSSNVNGESVKKDATKLPVESMTAIE